ncbi:L,D-transpeptidase family protein [Streptomyces sp. CBMA156]|uniref:L,D-transpeptidase family protein n=1 Tax=Streptomyces sp. CBMA156 TaxID=1930280 RepID=UPI001CB7BCE7|nr:L,D-transpeptidase family protein [Streptomyces sp. CBMA156]
MSGSDRATAYPPHQPMQDPVDLMPQQPYEGFQPYQQPVREGYDHGGYQPYGQAPDGYYVAYGQPVQPYEPEPGYEAVPVYEAGPVPAYEPEPIYEPEPVVLAAAPAAPVVGARSAARGRRRKAKQKRHGKAMMAGTALLVAATAGWYAVGQDGAKPGIAAADGPGPEGVSKPDQPVPAPAAAQAASDRQSAAPAADRSQTRQDGSVAAIPGLGAAFTAKIPAETAQVVVATGQDKNTDKNSVTLWTRTPEGRWLAGETWQGHNGKNGWTTDHNEGDLRSPIGVFGLTDAGGRKADPGSKLPYDKDPSFVVSGTGFFGDQLAGSFDYVVAINYNRVAGNTPLDTRRPMGSKKGGGIWLHVDHDGPTHGCVSIPEDKMAQLIRALDPAAHPVIVMGDSAALAA